jgi:vacuolar-type H+-ATPase subunit I/STV1
MAQSWNPPPPPQTAPGNIPNYLVPAILVTLFCCLPAGVVSIIYSTQVNSKVAAGDVQGAMDASKTARMWMFVAIGLGVVSMILGFVFGIFGALANA